VAAKGGGLLPVAGHLGLLFELESDRLHGWATRGRLADACQSEARSSERAALDRRESLASPGQPTAAATDASDAGTSTGVARADPVSECVAARTCTA